MAEWATCAACGNDPSGPEVDRKGVVEPMGLRPVEADALEVDLTRSTLPWPVVAVATMDAARTRARCAGREHSAWRSACCFGVAKGASSSTGRRPGARP